MNKKIITGLIVLMAISIVGIITVQLVWMNNALKVKNELFNRGVNEALTNTVKKLEDIHNFGIVTRMAFNDSVQWIFEPDEDEDFDTEMEVHVFSDESRIIRQMPDNKEPQHLKIIRQIKPNAENGTIEIRVETSTESELSVNSYNYNVEVESNKTAPVIVSKTGGFSEIIILNNDTIVSDADSLYTISRIKIDSVLMQLDSISFQQPNISRRAKLKGHKLKNLAIR